MFAEGFFTDPPGIRSYTAWNRDLCDLQTPFTRVLRKGFFRVLAKNSAPSNVRHDDSEQMLALGIQVPSQKVLAGPSWHLHNSASNHRT